uniref:DUF3164 family protein n=1 Tax=Candidatus Kentrum sp. LPFa TaxID=2126335 RepID=A0A450WDD3_9GAMM|nr:MAG: Protein of unknown function (DUF3164) [Candidatus Kentron sp. LPFa]
MTQENAARFGDYRKERGILIPALAAGIPDAPRDELDRVATEGAPATDAPAHPHGYLENARGDLVREENIKPMDLARDRLVRNLVEEAIAEQERLRAFKRRIYDQVDDFLEMAMAEYNVKYGGERNNVTLRSYDGRWKITFTVADQIGFNEGIVAAQQLIQEYIEEAKTLMRHAFRTNRDGNLSKGRVLSLLQYDFKGEKWRNAMASIKGSIETRGSKEYVRFYRREKAMQGERQISLDFSGV